MYKRRKKKQQEKSYFIHFLDDFYNITYDYPSHNIETLLRYRFNLFLNATLDREIEARKREINS